MMVDDSRRRYYEYEVRKLRSVLIMSMRSSVQTYWSNGWGREYLRCYTFMFWLKSMVRFDMTDGDLTRWSPERWGRTSDILSGISGWWMSSQLLLHLITTGIISKAPLLDPYTRAESEYTLIYSRCHIAPRLMQSVVINASISYVP